MTKRGLFSANRAAMSDGILLSIRKHDCCLTTPALGSLWIHRRGGRICMVVDVRRLTDSDGRHFAHQVEFKYQRTAGGHGLSRNRSTPTQTMPLETWRGLFTKEAP